MRFFPLRCCALRFLLPIVTACGGYGTGGGYGGMYGGAPATCPDGTLVVNVGTGPYGMSFSPAAINIHVNDTVCWTWLSGPHSVVSGTSCTANSLFCSPAGTNCAAAPAEGPGAFYMHKFTSPGTFPYFCGFHCAQGMIGSVTVLP